MSSSITRRPSGFVQWQQCCHGDPLRAEGKAAFRVKVCRDLSQQPRFRPKARDCLAKPLLMRIGFNTLPIAAAPAVGGCCL